MLKSVLFVAATAVEAEAVERIAGLYPVSGGFCTGETDYSLLVTGVGSAATAWEMQKWIASNYKPDMAVNIGIAGSYRNDIKIGDVVMPVSDCFADSGIEDGNKFLTLFEAGLAAADEFPFSRGRIEVNSELSEKLDGILRPVKAITVNTATGSDITRDRLLQKYDPDIETMEGATFFYICSREMIPFIAVRSVSNIVEKRNRAGWDIELALQNLTQKLNDVILTLK
jgi:futalosine hydrolase